MSVAKKNHRKMADPIRKPADGQEKNEKNFLKKAGGAPQPETNVSFVGTTHGGITPGPSAKTGGRTGARVGRAERSHSRCFDNGGGWEKKRIENDRDYRERTFVAKNKGNAKVPVRMRKHTRIRQTLGGKEWGDSIERKEGKRVEVQSEVGGRRKS